MRPDENHFVRMDGWSTADDLGFRKPDGHFLVDGIFVGKESANEALIDDGDFGSLLAVALFKKAFTDQRDLQRMKVLRIHHLGRSAFLKGDILAFGEFGRRLAAGDNHRRSVEPCFSGRPAAKPTDSTPGTSVRSARAARTIFLGAGPLPHTQICHGSFRELESERSGGCLRRSQGQRAAD
jgi:hypothetical protein